MVPVAEVGIAAAVPLVEALLVVAVAMVVVLMVDYLLDRSVVLHELLLCEDNEEKQQDVGDGEDSLDAAVEAAEVVLYTFLAAVEVEEDLVLMRLEGLCMAAVGVVVAALVVVQPVAADVEDVVVDTAVVEAWVFVDEAELEADQGIVVQEWASVVPAAAVVDAADAFVAVDRIIQAELVESLEVPVAAEDVVVVLVVVAAVHIDIEHCSAWDAVEDETVVVLVSDAVAGWDVAVVYVLV